jgi:hypothetical protein
VQKPATTQTRPSGTTPSATRPTTSSGGARMDSTSYNQLEQDRQARNLGTQRWGGGGGYRGGYGGGERGGWRR